MVFLFNQLSSLHYCLLGRVDKRNVWGVIGAGFHRLDAVTVTQPCQSTGWNTRQSKTHLL